MESSFLLSELQMVLYEPRNSQPVDSQKVQSLIEELNIESGLAQVLVMRGYDTVQSAWAFLHPSFDQLQDPGLLLDMDKAVVRIRKALADEESIVIYGDYDADGVCATSILMEYFTGLHANVSFYIPERHREGYGLNKAAVQNLAESGIKLLITVDCGIASRNEVELACKLGMDVIVTDHHECPEILPNAVAVIDPKRPNQNYDFNGLCGAGVAGRLVEALGGRQAMLRALDLMALATVADLVPLTGENRVIVSEGLKVIHEGKRTGLTRLCEVAGLDLKTISAGQLAFQLGPRINAGGRMDVSSKSVELMTTQDEALALAIAHELDLDNSHRKAVGEEIAREALKQAEEEIDLSRQLGIVLWNDYWDSGVQGIVASTLVEKYHRPAILLTKEEEYYVGSARSISGVHLFKVLQKCSDFLTRFGGHEMAAGMAVKKENLEAFRQRFNEVLKEETDSQLYLPRQSYDLSMTLSEMNEKLVDELESMAPFGMANPSPVMRIRAQMRDVRRMGSEGAHFRTELTDESSLCSGVAFRMEAPNDGQDIWYDILMSPEINEWKGRRNLQCHIQRYQPVDLLPEQMAAKVDDSLWRNCALSQILMTEKRGNAVAICNKEESMLWLHDNAIGTLVLAHTPQGLKNLELPKMHTEIQTCSRSISSQNTLVLAPDYEKLALSGKKWQKLLLLDGPICQDFAKILAEELRCSQIGIIMNNNLDFRWMSWPDFCEAALREYFIGLRKLISNGGYFRSRESALAQAADAMTLEQSQARIVLKIFNELGLIMFENYAPYLALIPGKKVNLADSETYRRCLQVFKS